MRTFLMLLAMGMALSAPGETATAPAPTPTSSTKLPRDVVTAATNAFSLRLYKEVKADAGNLVISPLSVAVLLALTRHGASGSTEQQITSALQLSPDRQSTAVGFGELLASLRSSGEATLLTANALYAHQSFRLKDSFRQTAITSFRAGAQELNFLNDTDKARRTINQWVEENTEGKIKDLFKQGGINKDTRLVLVNAIYFKAGWWKPFEVHDTNTQPFHVSRTSRVNVTTMHGDFQTDYGELPAVNAKAVKLPYKAGDSDMNMIILLPNLVDGLQQLEANLDQLDLTNLTPNFGEVIISLPKLRIDSEFRLKEKLKQLGVTDIFTQNADLRDIAEEALYVDDVVQKTFIGVDEKGTEAAVATGVNLMLLSSYPRVEFKVNHPFLFLIQTGETIVFLGRVTNPTT